MLVKKFDTPKPKCLLYNHRVSSNSNIPDLETNNDNAGNPPPPRIEPIINGMSQQSQQQPTKHPETHTLINIQPHTEVLLKKKEYGSRLSCCPCSALLLSCISQSKLND